MVCRTSATGMAWVAASVRPMAMSTGTVHVWRACLSDQRLLNRCREYLSSEEMRRAKSYGDIRLRDDFMACRACLRDILSRYLQGTPPPEVRLGKNRMGKPTLIDTEPHLFFNVAHTGNMAVIAVSNVAAVGVDIERKDRKVRNLPLLIQKRFTEREGRQLIAMSSNNAGTIHWDLLRSNFLKFWTLKEAFVKCTGEGIARGLKTFEVNLDEDVPRILSVNDMSDPANEWSFYTVEVGEDHVGAMVTATGKRATVRYLDWSSVVSTEGGLPGL